jgi:hypothetical protein
MSDKPIDEKDRIQLNNVINLFNDEAAHNHISQSAGHNIICLDNGDQIFVPETIHFSETIVCTDPDTGEKVTKVFPMLMKLEITDLKIKDGIAGFAVQGRIQQGWTYKP